MRTKTILTFAALSVAIGALFMFDQIDPRRKAVVDAAEGELGSKDANKYWADAMPGAPESDYPKDWCGAFALWALHRAGLGLNLDWVIGQGFLLKNLPMTKNPKPGDIAYFDHNQHHAVVSEVTSSSVGLINGNGAGGQVTRSIAPMNTVTAFFSIERLLETNPGTPV